MDLSNILDSGGKKPSALSGQTQFKVEEKETDFVLLTLWLGFVISVLATGFLFYQNFSLNNKVAAKKSDSEIALGKLNSSTYQSLQSQAANFQSRIADVDTALNARYSMANFLPEVFKRIDANVTVTNISLTSDGKFTMTGKTDTYLSAADQVMALRGWKSGDKEVMSDIELGSISIAANKNNSNMVPLSITANLSSVPSDNAQGAK